MKFTLNWLKQALNTDASLDEICESLTAIGLEVEDVHDPAALYAPFKVAYVEKAEPHPDADKLQICTVNAEGGTFQVVCGAPNARAGMKGIFASEGTYIPGLDITLKKAKIRGVESCGMLVSEREMMLSDEHEGIIDLDGDYEVGTPMADVFGLNDPVIEIALTPNRADCAGVYGIARDLAAAGLGTLNPVKSDPVKGSFKSPVSISIEDEEGCPLFLGRTIKGVKNGPSPEWMQQLLKAVGLRPISALVDITNFISMDHARPLHVYDADKLSGNIAVKAAKGGEELEALDDKTYKAAPHTVSIHDDSGLIGFGGIIGGISTGADENTVNVFLEAAYFNPERIARAGRDIGVMSDARYRFERGVDPAFTFDGMELATQMILDICGGEASEVVQAGALPDWDKVIDYDPSYCQQLIGLNVPESKQVEILQALGFECQKDGKIYKVSVPSWRGDVFGRADLVEEIIRIVGFDDIPSVSVRSETTVPSPAETPLLSRSRKARSALATAGLQECVTWSFTGHRQAQEFGMNDNERRAALTLKNPISSELDVMRPSILPNLLEASLKNAAQGYSNIALFEVGPVFEGTKPEEQKIVAAGLRAHQNAPRSWSDDKATRGVDLYDVKADALAALEAAGAPASNAQITRDAPEYYHPGRSGALRLGPNVLAYFGEIHPAILDEMGHKNAAAGFEVFLENIPEPKKKSGTEKPYLTLEPLQPLTRDFAFVVDDAVAASDLERAAMAADKNLITAANVFDVYTGQGVEEGKKSLALEITIQPKGESLKDKDLETLSQKVIEMVEKKIGGILRG